MDFATDYGDGFVRLQERQPLWYEWNGVVDGINEAFATQRCVQDFSGSILLNEKDSQAILSRMSYDDFWFALDDLTLVPKQVTTIASGKLILVMAGTYPFTVCQTSELMGAVKQYLLANPS